MNRNMNCSYGNYWNSTLYKAAIDSKPDIVVFMLGTYDMFEMNWKGEDNFTRDYSELVQGF